MRSWSMRTRRTGCGWSNSGCGRGNDSRLADRRRRPAGRADQSRHRPGGERARWKSKVALSSARRRAKKGDYSEGGGGMAEWRWGEGGEGTHLLFEEDEVVREVFPTPPTGAQLRPACQVGEERRPVCVQVAQRLQRGEGNFKWLDDWKRCEEFLRRARSGWV